MVNCRSYYRIGMSVFSNAPQFILSRHWSDTPDGIELRFWLVLDQQHHCWTVAGQSSVCFVAENQLTQWRLLWKRLGLEVAVSDKRFTALMGDWVLPVYTDSYQGQRRWTRSGRDVGLKVWEDDINPADRYLMERFLFGSLCFDNNQPRPATSEPALRVLSLDIETSWYTPGETPELYSVALAGAGYQQVFVVESDVRRHDENVSVVWCADIQSCLEATVAAIQSYDPDCLIGWNVIDFDLRILQQHCDGVGLEFAIGRHNTVPRWRRHSEKNDRYFIDVEGRMVVDGPGAFRSAAWFFEDFSLETVSQSLLKRGKKIEHHDDRVGEIERMYREDIDAFAQYNLEDAQLVLELFETAGLWHFLIQRSHLTGLPVDRAGGSSAAFNTVYMPRLHRAGYIASSVGEQTLRLASPGGYVMDSIPGLYQDVLVLDFKSLYPSIIRTFLIDPLGLQEGLKAAEQDTVPGFIDARFHRDRHILPALIDTLWQARDQAKAEKNAPLSQAIKIIMNSFYGVLGSHLCRFFDPRLASSITMRGHEILQQTRVFIEQSGQRVIYGDTDSVFVHAKDIADPKALGQQLAVALNQWWTEEIQRRFLLDSHLEIEFETHYQQFVMPTIRGTEKGSKKRYAGWIEENGQHRLVFKGLEAVRSDWTPMAKSFQTGLYERIFRGENYIKYIQDTVAKLKAGELDGQLIYRRRLRRQVEQYEKQLPPQVQAALLKRQHNPQWYGRTIEYVKTVSGWQPIPYVSAALDYDHYQDKQLAPIADAILHFLGTNFNEVTREQLSLF
ncbi:MAG: DNA polymerase II [Reinekea sp.]